MKKYTNEELAEIVAEEGLGYAIQHYLSSKDIKDKEMRELWQHAFEALEAVECRLPKVREYD